VNWGIYIWAVTHGHVIEASLGYFINPLVSVLLGVLLLGERLRRVQWTAVALAAAGVLWLTVQHGTPPWIALSLAVSFAFYGLLRRWASVDAVPGLAVENLLLFLPALGWLLLAERHGVAAFGHQPGWQDVLLVLGGALTAIPLIGFAYGAKRIPYTLVGLLQYISPSLQLLCGVLLLGETFSATQALGFGLIWAGLAVYAGDGWQRARRAQRALLAETGSVGVVRFKRHSVEPTWRGDQASRSAPGILRRVQAACSAANDRSAELRAFALDRAPQRGQERPAEVRVAAPGIRASG
jgi:chloramphenicol-sensitive protein RarD